MLLLLDWLKLIDLEQVNKVGKEMKKGLFLFALAVLITSTACSSGTYLTAFVPITTTSTEIVTNTIIQTTTPVPITITQTITPLPITSTQTVIPVPTTIVQTVTPTITIIQTVIPPPINITQTVTPTITVTITASVSPTI